MYLLSRVVNHAQLNKSDHFTVSPDGVTRVHNSEVEFTSLNRWEEEYKKYLEMIKIKTFANFRIWKTFAAWKEFVKSRYVELCLLSL